MQRCFLLSRKSLRFLGSATGIVIANRKNRCDFGALSLKPNQGSRRLSVISTDICFKCSRVHKSDIAKGGSSLKGCPESRISKTFSPMALQRCNVNIFFSRFLVKTFIYCYRTPGPQKGSRRVSGGVPEEVSEGFSKGFRRVSEGVSLGPF